MAYIPYPKGIGVLRHSYKKEFLNIVSRMNPSDTTPINLAVNDSAI
jgi:hypothetical protein